MKQSRISKILLTAIWLGAASGAAWAQCDPGTFSVSTAFADAIEPNSFWNNEIRNSAHNHAPIRCILEEKSQELADGGGSRAEIYDEAIEEVRAEIARQLRSVSKEGLQDTERMGYTDQHADFLSGAIADLIPNLDAGDVRNLGDEWTTIRNHSYDEFKREATIAFDRAIAGAVADGETFSPPTGESQRTYADRVARETWEAVATAQARVFAEEYLRYDCPDEGTIEYRSLQDVCENAASDNEGCECLGDAEDDPETDEDEDEDQDEDEDEDEDQDEDEDEPVDECDQAFLNAFGATAGPAAAGVGREIALEQGEGMLAAACADDPSGDNCACVDVETPLGADAVVTLASLTGELYGPDGFASIDECIAGLGERLVEEGEEGTEAGVEDTEGLTAAVTRMCRSAAVTEGLVDAETDARLFAGDIDLKAGTVSGQDLGVSGEVSSAEGEIVAGTFYRIEAGETIGDIAGALRNALCPEDDRSCVPIWGEGGFANFLADSVGLVEGGDDTVSFGRFNAGELMWIPPAACLQQYVEGGNAGGDSQECDCFYNPANREDCQSCDTDYISDLQARQEDEDFDFASIEDEDERTARALDSELAGQELEELEQVCSQGSSTPDPAPIGFQ